MLNLVFSFFITVICKLMFVHLEEKVFSFIFLKKYNVYLFVSSTASNSEHSFLSTKVNPIVSLHFIDKSKRGGKHISSKFKALLNIDILIPSSKLCKCLKTGHEVKSILEKKLFFPFYR